MLKLDKIYALQDWSDDVEALVGIHEELMNALLTLNQEADEIKSSYGDEYYGLLSDGILIQLANMSNQIYKILKTKTEK